MRRAVLVLALLFATPVLAGPFGLQMGTFLETLQRTIKLKAIDRRPHHYLATKLPMGQANFEGYVLFVTPQNGLCRITAITPTITTGTNGAQLRALFESVAKPIEAKYDKGVRVYELAPTSRFDAAADWMLALLNKDRVMAEDWANRPLPEDLIEIRIEARAETATTGHVTIDYDFKNIRFCEQSTGSK